jgi:succinate dehydrogenase/fumarate reductase flavoprotein subunit
VSLKNTDISEVKSDILIVGSEAAGAKAAIEAQEEGPGVLVVSNENGKDKAT